MTNSSATAAPLDPVLERQRRQKSRSIAIALGLFGLVSIFYAATIVRMGAINQNQAKVEGSSATGPSQPRSTTP